jgi:Ion channel
MTAESAIGAGMGRRPNERWVGFASRIADAFGLVLLLVLATYVAASLTTYRGWSAVAISALATSTAVVALASARARHWVVRSAAALGIGCVALAAVAALSGTTAFLAIASLVQMVLLTAATLTVLRAVISESEVGFRTILGAISVYLIFGVLFTSLYVAIDRLQAGPFFASGGHDTGDFIFFSFTTLTTTGYGNLVPAEQPGKMFAGLEMLFGQIFLVTLIAGLVSLWRPGRRNSAAAQAEPD